MGSCQVLGMLPRGTKVGSSVLGSCEAGPVWGGAMNFSGADCLKEVR